MAGGSCTLVRPLSTSRTSLSTRAHQHQRAISCRRVQVVDFNQDCFLSNPRVQSLQEHTSVRFDTVLLICLPFSTRPPRIVGGGPSYESFAYALG